MAYLDPRQVLSYLNELGYTNITKEQLKEFMIDLRKIMKYDERQYTEDVENLNPQYSPRVPQRDVFDELYRAQTVASNGKIIEPKKSSYITVQFTKPRGNAAGCEATEHIGCRSRPSSEHIGVQVSPKQVSYGLGSNSTTTVAESHQSNTASLPSTARTCQTVCSEKSENTKCSKARKKPVKSFIRPRLNTKPPKSDPVALYHQYQAEWKKMKIPGQSNHSDVRWAVREKMLGEKYDYCY